MARRKEQRYPAFPVDLHKALWKWLEENPGRQKYQWPQWAHHGGPVEPGKYFCIACYYNESLKTTTEDRYQCTHCPICEGGRDTLKECMNGLFEKWFLADNPGDRAKYANIIGNLPVRPLYQ